MHRTFATVLVACVLCLASPPSRAAADFAALLEQAESVRSADPAKFEALLGELNEAIAQATPAQREQLEYLKIYRLAYTGRFDVAIARARTLFDTSQDNQIRFRTGALMVNGFAATRDFTEGLRMLDQTLALAEGIEDRDLRHHGWTVAAVIYNQVGQYELGRIYADKVLADEASPRTACFTGYSRLEALFNLGLLQDEEASIRALMDQCASAGEPLGGYFLHTYLARQWVVQGERDRAITMLESLMPEFEATRYPRLVGEVNSLLAELLFDAGEFARAEARARQALANSTGIQHSLPLVTAYRVLYETALRRGDTAAALEHHRNFADADKAYLDNVKARELAFQLVRHETQQKTQTIELLNRQNQVLTLEQEVAAKTAQANRLLIVLLAFLLATIGYFAYKTKKTQLSFRRLAETDALTGLSNRHHFSRRAEQALDYCRKSGEDVGLVMFDLDDFKGINDQHGHAVGDWVLKAVAAACREACRKNDLVGRLGGEEFAFLLVGCDLAASAQLARECRERIAAIDTSPTGKRFRVTASFGVAGSADAGHDYPVLLARADEAMYRSKHEGRDRVSVHAPAPVPAPAPATH